MHIFHRKFFSSAIFFGVIFCAVILAATDFAQAATFVVDSANDNINSGDSNPGDGVCEDAQSGTRCTLRAAIEESNVNGVFDTIEFALPFTINVSNSAFPTIVEALLIDGRPTPGYNNAATEIGDAPPVVWLNGSGLAGIPSADGLRSNNVVFWVLGVGIINFPDKGIDIDTGNLSGSIDRCWIGVDSTVTAAPNNVGIEASGDQVFIGDNRADNDADLGNLISGNSSHGVSLLLCGRCEVVNNIIGADEFAFSALPNGGAGVHVTGEVDSKIGGLDKGNDILFNSGWGVEMLTGGNDVIDNNISINVGGGVMANGSGNRIGISSGGNAIQDNMGRGIWLGNTLAADTSEVRDNQVVDNSGDGIYLQHGSGAIINGNAVWDNNANGIRIDDDSNSVTFNTVGFIDLQQPSVLGNGNNGVVVNASNVTVRNNQIGGATGPAHEGIDVWSGNGSDISDNYIGITDDLNAIPNDAAGIRVDPSVTDLEITGNAIGNSFDGIRIEGDGVRVCDNEIGSDAFDDFGNSSEGVRVLGNSNIIGSEVLGCAGNIIGFNGSDGLQIEGDQNLIRDNLIGNNDGPAGNQLQFGNSAGGLLLVVGAANNIIQGNVIGSNGADGARVANSAGLGNDFQANAMLINGSGLGVDLNDDGPTPNDPGDPDSGPNRLQNTPELISVTAISVSMAEVEYRVDSLGGNSSYPIRVEFFRAWASSREGHELYGTDVYDETPGTIKTVTIPWFETVPRNMTAMATDALGNSSEFSDTFLVDNFDGGGDGFFSSGFESP